MGLAWGCHGVGVGLTWGWRGAGVGLAWGCPQKVSIFFWDPLENSWGIVQWIQGQTPLDALESSPGIS